MADPARTNVGDVVWIGVVSNVDSIFVIRTLEKGVSHTHYAILERGNFVPSYTMSPQWVKTQRLCGIVVTKSEYTLCVASSISGTRVIVDVRETIQNDDAEVCVRGYDDTL